MSTSDVFLDSYARIEKYLRSSLAVNDYVPFYKLVDLGMSRFASVRHFATDLREFADLRNAIVHERTDGHVIAEPLDLTTVQFKKIADLLLQPPSLLQLAHNPIAVIGPDESIALAVTKMAGQSFSQLPVVGTNGCEAVLTTNTIARWLGANLEVGVVSIEETPVREALRSQEPDEVHRFFPRTASIVDALEAFQAEHARGRALSALLVTHSGRPSESLLGIVTLSDLPAAYGLLTPRGAGPDR